MGYGRGRRLYNRIWSVHRRHSGGRLEAYPTGTFQFSHALVQETLASELSLTRRVRLHGAEILEELHSEDLESHALNPMEPKKRLAWDVTRQFHDKDAADAAQAHFERVVQGGDVPTDIPEMSLAELQRMGAMGGGGGGGGSAGGGGGSVGVRVDALMLAAGLAPSNAQVERLLAQGAVERISKDGDSIPVTGGEAGLLLQPGEILKVGKRRFVRLTDS